MIVTFSRKVISKTYETMRNERGFPYRPVFALSDVCLHWLARLAVTAGLSSPVRRRLANQTFEGRAKVRVRAKTAAKSDVDHTVIGLQQQMPCVFKPSVEQEFVRRKTGCGAKLCGEVHTRKPDASGNVGQTNRLRQMRFDIVDRPPDARRGQRFGRADRLGLQVRELTGQQPRGDRIADTVGVEPAEQRIAFLHAG